MVRHLFHSVLSRYLLRVLVVAFGVASLAASASPPLAGAIVNGTDTPPSSAVGRATVFVDEDINGDGIFGDITEGCTGTLVAADLVLTASHCIEEERAVAGLQFRGPTYLNDQERPDRFYPPPTGISWRVAWGSADPSSGQTTASSGRACSSTCIPGPAGATAVTEWAKPGNADMVLLRTQQRVPGQPVQIMTRLDGGTDPSSLWLSGKSFTAAGYGDDSDALSNVLSTHLNQGKFNGATFPCRNQAHKVCVQSANGSVGPRGGDSGGPLYWTDPAGVLRMLGIHQGQEASNGGRYIAPFYRGGSYSDNTPMSNIGEWLERMVKGVPGGTAYLQNDNVTVTDHYTAESLSSNPAGTAPRVRKLGQGRYQAVFHGLRQTAGRELRARFVTAVSSGGNFCNVSDHPDDLSNGDRGDVVNVRCYNSAAQLADSRFSLMTDISDTDALLEVPRFSTSSTTVAGGPALHGSTTVTRLSTGRYRVDAPGWSAGNWRSVMVNAIASSPTRCHVESWTLRSAVVRCLNQAGSPVESRFAFAATSGSVSSYALVSNPTLTSQTVSGSRANIAGSSSLPGINRLSTGVYNVSFAGRPSSVPGSVQVMAHGATTNHCKLDSATATRVTVRCFDRSNTPADTQFGVRLVDPLDAGRRVTVEVNELRATSRDACGAMDMYGQLGYRPSLDAYLLSQSFSRVESDVRTSPIAISGRSSPGSRYWVAELSVKDADTCDLQNGEVDVDIVPHANKTRLRIVVDLLTNTVKVEDSPFQVLGGFGTWWQDGINGPATARAEFTVKVDVPR